MRDSPFRVRAPGRVCLFGEHSDYLGLDVIAAAIDLAIDITAEPRDDNTIHITYADLNESDSFNIDSEISYRTKRDYFRSAFNVMARKDILPKHGWKLEVRGNIPLAAGLSGSSAMTVGAVMTIIQMAGRRLEETEIAEAAHEAEVVEFGESGGTMDHFASVYGGIIHIDMEEGHVTRLPARLGSLVIGDSCEEKSDTVGDLRYIRTAVERGYEIISDRIPSFNRRITPLREVYSLRNGQPSSERRMAEATLHNRDLTYRALGLLSKEQPNPIELGRLLNEHHEILKDGLDRSTPKIEGMIEAAMRAGALGCKINGSGGGGTMMAYCHGNEEEVASAIQEVGGRTYKVKIGSGASLMGIA
jgi:galactokinase